MSGCLMPTVPPDPSMEALPWVRRFYRARLARYRWAQWLKRVYLWLRMALWVPMRAFFIWQMSHRWVATMRWLDRFGKHNGSRLVRYMVQGGTLVLAGPLRLFFWLTGWHIRRYGMCSFLAYAEMTAATQQELVPAREFPLEMPDVYPEAFRQYFHHGTWSWYVPAVHAFEVPHVKVMGKSDLLFLEDQCLHHALYQFERDYLFEEMHDIVSINARMKVLMHFKGESSGEIATGISLLGSATANYVHWLTETLPKLALIDDVDA